MRELLEEDEEEEEEDEDEDEELELELLASMVIYYISYYNLCFRNANLGKICWKDRYL